MIAYQAGILANVEKLVLLRDGNVALFGPREAVLAKVAPPTLSDPGQANRMTRAATEDNRQNAAA